MMLSEVVRHAILLLLALATAAPSSTASFLMPTSTSSIIQKNGISYLGHSHNKNNCRPFPPHHHHAAPSSSFHHSYIRSRRTSHLNVISSITIAAGSTLILSSTTGMLFEQKLNGGGTCDYIVNICIAIQHFSTATIIIYFY